MNLFENILIPVDLDEKNVASVDVAGGLAQRYSASVTLLHVIETLDNVPFEELRNFYDKLESGARDRLNHLEERLSGLGVGARGVILYGKRIEQIVQYARENRSTLILLNSHVVDPNDPGQGWNSISHFIAIL